MLRKPSPNPNHLWYPTSVRLADIMCFKQLLDLPKLMILYFRTQYISMQDITIYQTTVCRCCPIVTTLLLPWPQTYSILAMVVASLCDCRLCRESEQK